LLEPNREIVVVQTFLRELLPAAIWRVD
jgi:hypothetical protein